MDANRKQARIAAIAGFREEVRRLEALGLLTLDAAERRAIARHHDEVLADLDPSGHMPVHRGLRMAATLGALTLWGGVLFHLDRLWPQLPLWSAMAILIAQPAIFLTLSELLALRTGAGYAATVSAALSALSLIAGLFIADETLGTGLVQESLFFGGLYATLLGLRRMSAFMTGSGVLLAICSLFAIVGTMDGRSLAVLGQRGDIAIAMGAVLFLAGLVSRLPHLLAPFLRAGGLALFGGALILARHDGTTMLGGAGGILSGLYALAPFLTLPVILYLAPRKGWGESGWLAVLLLILLLVDIAATAIGDRLPPAAILAIAILLLPPAVWILLLYRRYERHAGAARSVS
ncbi:MAG: hypothetical protein Kow00104_19890 [Rhodothalassiaceae bacterium]